MKSDTLYIVERVDLFTGESEDVAQFETYAEAAKLRDELRKAAQALPAGRRPAYDVYSLVWRRED